MSRFKVGDHVVLLSPTTTHYGPNKPVDHYKAGLVGTITYKVDEAPGFWGVRFNGVARGTEVHHTNLKHDTIHVLCESADLINSPDGWQFNHCWANRCTIQVPSHLSNAAICRRVKRALGLSGPHVTLWVGSYRLRNTCIGFSWYVD